MAVVLNGLLIFCVVNFCLTTPEEPYLTFEELYQYGKNEYTMKNWPDCIGYMKRALDDFRYLEDELVWCRRKCMELVELPDYDRISQLHSYSARAFCLMRCKRDKFTESRKEVKEMSVYFDFMERKPHQYMHICYWNQGDLAMAVQSAYTFLVVNPSDKDTLDGLAFYMQQEGFKESMLVDTMRMSYEERFISGMNAYNSDDWSRCSDELELSLEKTLEQDERCRFLCMDKIDWGATEGNSELDILITSMGASVVRCQHNCLYRLSLVNGHYVEHIVAAHFEYLHYCQYKLMRGTDAARSVANYLLFDNNPLMRRNKYIYMKKYGKKDLFIPDSNMVDLYKQRELESRYLRFIENKFKFINNEFPPDQTDDKKKLNMDISIEDDFDYTAIEHLLIPSECELLRTPFDSIKSEALTKEITRRLSVIWPSAKLESRKCNRYTRETICTRAVVLSIEKLNCSEWLGRIHSGCSVVFCV